ncbi:hypothetical protein BC936DRAFT_149894 [Jimgerdemannia flammicorona]|uniref:Uncharacterized protein n=1 Tax=Jimgerdemannia flammicorona TaxID=994334 RepID=A0A433CZW2_9FUNG|nr:hypothetical protein BC936DRAFT_149894 [Jimgerdemannia flammicorona]
MNEKIDGRTGDSVKEKIPANGADWDSTSINRRVLKMVEDIFGHNRYQAMTEDLGGFMNLNREIEIAKCSFNLETDVLLALPYDFTADECSDVSSTQTVETYSIVKKVGVIY